MLATQGGQNQKRKKVPIALKKWKLVSQEQTGEYVTVFIFTLKKR